MLCLVYLYSVTYYCTRSLTFNHQFKQQLINFTVSVSYTFVTFVHCIVSGSRLSIHTIINTLSYPACASVTASKVHPLPCSRLMLLSGPEPQVCFNTRLLQRQTRAHVLLLLLTDGLSHIEFLSHKACKGDYDVITLINYSSRGYRAYSIL